MKSSFILFFLLFSIGIFAQKTGDYELFIQKAKKAKVVNDKLGIERYYKQAHVVNPSGYEALVALGVNDANKAPFSIAFVERDSLFKESIVYFNSAIAVDTAQTTCLNLLKLDAYNKNLSRGYKNAYNAEQMDNFSTDIQSIIELCQSRFDYKQYQLEFEQIIEMLERKLITNNKKNE